MHRSLLAASVVSSVFVALSPLVAQERQADALLRDGDAQMSRLQYEDALASYRAAQTSTDGGMRVRAGAGAMHALLKMGQFAEAERQGSDVAARDPKLAGAVAVHGDALWAAGMFTEAEERYDAALKIDGDDPM